MNKEVKRAFDDEEIVRALNGLGMNVRPTKEDSEKSAIIDLLNKIKDINSRLQKR